MAAERRMRERLVATLRAEVGMFEQVLMNHQHADGEQAMDHVDDERIDGLRLREYTCPCGFSAAVLTRVTEEEPGESWPFRFQTTPPVS